MKVSSVLRMPTRSSHPTYSATSWDPEVSSSSTFWSPSTCSSVWPSFVITTFCLRSNCAPASWAWATTWPAQRLWRPAHRHPNCSPPFSVSLLRNPTSVRVRSSVPPSLTCSSWSVCAVCARQVFNWAGGRSLEIPVITVWPVSKLHFAFFILPILLPTDRRLRVFIFFLSVRFDCGRLRWPDINDR